MDYFQKNSAHREQYILPYIESYIIFAGVYRENPGGIMKARNISLILFRTLYAILIVHCSTAATAEDLHLFGGVTEEINYTVEGSIIIEDANVIMYNPAHILGAVISGSGAVVDIYGGQIDVMLLISTSDNDLNDAYVTVYGSDFAVNDVPVVPGTTELYIPYQELSGVYYDGTPFSFMVDCYLTGSPGGSFYFQTVKLGWIESQSDIELSHHDYDFGQVKIATEQSGEITVYNLGNASLTINELMLEQDEYEQFNLELLGTLPVTLEPDKWLTLNVSFEPVIEGLSEAVVYISSDDPNDPLVSVQLLGEGMSLSAVEQSAIILDIYDTALEAETITGVGNKKSAANKSETFGKMLAVADELLLADYRDEALETLLMIEAKCDGQKSPKDFIQGPDAEVLNMMINELIAALQQE